MKEPKARASTAAGVAYPAMQCEKQVAAGVAYRAMQQHAPQAVLLMTMNEERTTGCSRRGLPGDATAHAQRGAFFASSVITLLLFYRGLQQP